MATTIPAARQAPFYKRILKAIARIMHCVWLEVRNTAESPSQVYPYQWAPVQMVAAALMHDHFEQNPLHDMVWGILLMLFITHVAFRGILYGQFSALKALRDLPSSERDRKLEEMWLYFGWTPLKPEDDAQNVAEVYDMEKAEEKGENEKQPLLLDV